MSLGELTSKEAVRSAMAEFDELGREAFLKKYGSVPVSWFDPFVVNRPG